MPKLESEKTVKKQAKKKRKAPSTAFKKGDPRINRKGRPKGSLNRSTMWKMVIERLAKGKEIPGVKNVNDVYYQIGKTAIEQAIAGDKDGRRDVHDGLFGKQSTHHQVESTGPMVITFDPTYLDRMPEQEEDADDDTT